ncbi:unnamed protein product, partial [Protopolystoma xenopodis]
SSNFIFKLISYTIFSILFFLFPLIFLFIFLFFFQSSLFPYHPSRNWSDEYACLTQLACLLNLTPSNLLSSPSDFITRSSLLPDDLSLSRDFGSSVAKGNDASTSLSSSVFLQDTSKTGLRSKLSFGWNRTKEKLAAIDLPASITSKSISKGSKCKNDIDISGFTDASSSDRYVSFRATV